MCQIIMYRYYIWEVEYWFLLQGLVTNFVFVVLGGFVGWYSRLKNSYYKKLPFSSKTLFVYKNFSSYKKVRDLSYFLWENKKTVVLITRNVSETFLNILAGNDKKTHQHAFKKFNSKNSIYVLQTSIRVYI